VNVPVNLLMLGIVDIDDIYDDDIDDDDVIDDVRGIVDDDGIDGSRYGLLQYHIDAGCDTGVPAALRTTHAFGFVGPHFTLLRILLFCAYIRVWLRGTVHTFMAAPWILCTHATCLWLPALWYYLLHSMLSPTYLCCLSCALPLLP